MNAPVEAWVCAVCVLVWVTGGGVCAQLPTVWHGDPYAAASGLHGYPGKRHPHLVAIRLWKIL